MFKLRDGREVEIREPREKDAAELQKFINRLVEEETFILRNRKASLEEEGEWLEKRLEGTRKGDAVMRVAEAEGKIVASGAITRKKWKSSHVGHLGISVADGWRGAGLGTAMVKKLLEEAKGEFEMVELTVFSNNPARELYKRLGFKEEAVVPRRIKQKSEYVDEVVMSREP